MLRIESVETSGAIWQSWFFCLLYCGISFPMFYVWAFMDRFHLAGALISGFFAVWGVVYLWVTFQKTFEYRRFGSIFLQLQETPSLGGVLAGSLRALGVGLHPVVLDLSASEETFGTDSKGRQTRTEAVVWRKLHPLRGRGGRIEFSVPVPDEPEIRRGVPLLWKLRVHAELPGADLDRTFAIDVAQGSPRTGGTLPQPTASAAATPDEDAVDAIESPPASTSAGVLIAANLLMLAGVLLWDWRVGDLVILYWVENLVIGAMHVLRILFADPEAPRGASSPVQSTGGERIAARIALAAFFLVHYGAFCAGHGVFLASIFPVRGSMGAELEIWQILAGMLREPAALGAIAVLVASHGYSFARNYIGRGEYRRVDIGRMMLRPYGRIVVVHLFILGGGLLLQGLQAPVAALLLFIVLKTGIDYAMHRRERRLLSAEGA